MLNKFNKTIHNKYSRYFKFIFFLRYLFAIFFLSITLFLSIPNFFNYEKRAIFIKEHLNDYYNLKISGYDKIEFQALPSPKLKFINANINLDSKNIKFKVKNFMVYPKLINIYNYENFKSKKIALKNNNIVLKNSDLKFLINFYYKQKNKIYIDNLDLEIKDEIKSIIDIKKIKLSNFGYNKNLIRGEIFGKKFKAKSRNNFESINFKILNSGFGANIRFDEERKNNLVSGQLKSKILNTNIKLNFKYDNKKLNFFNSHFRNKNITFSSDSLFVLNPFLEINSKINIEDIDAKVFKRLDLDALLKSKEMIKELNIKNEINYKSNRFSNDLINNVNLKIDLAYGRINYKKNFSVAENSFSCAGSINLLDEYPLLFFDCSIILNNNKFLKKFSTKSKDKYESLKFNIKGNLNVLNNKINFKNITTNKNYKASKEDLKYFKKIFEDIVLDESFFEIFNYEKIKQFILEIS